MFPSTGAPLAPLSHSRRGGSGFAHLPQPQPLRAGMKRSREIAFPPKGRPVAPRLPQLQASRSRPAASRQPHVARPSLQAEPLPPLSADQAAIVHRILTSPRENFFLTGAGGTGKTVIIGHLVRRSVPLSTEWAALTGVAAQAIRGVTWHSLTGLGMDRVESEDDFGALCSRNDKLLRRIRRVQRIVVDEVSMMPARQLERVERVFRVLRNSQEPFGGIQMVLVGDLFQLPPVHKGRVDPSRYLTDSRTLAESPLFLLGFRHIQLSVSHRQKDAAFLGLLGRLRKGLLDEQDWRDIRALQRPQMRWVPQVQAATGLPQALLRLVHAYIGSNRAGAGPFVVPTVLHSDNQSVDSHNNAELCGLSGAEVAYDCADSYPGAASGAASATQLRGRLDRDCTAVPRLVLKEGAQVILLKNKMDSGLANGSLGVVEGFAPASVASGDALQACGPSRLPPLPLVRFEATGSLEQIVPETWEVVEDGVVVAYRTQVPLRLAWAITIHKSQGMTLDSLTIHAHRIFERGQLYVAMSRARSPDGLSVYGAERRHVQVDPRVLQLYERMPFFEETAGAANTGEYAFKRRRC